MIGRKVRERAALTQEQILHAIGLERQRAERDRTMALVLVFGAGLLAGTGLGMLLAPTSGAELRRRVWELVVGRRREEPVDTAGEAGRAEAAI